MQFFCETVPNVVHAAGVFGRDFDFTLCGFSLDGAEGHVVEIPLKGAQISCDQCVTIIKFCKAINPRKVATHV